MHDDAFGRDQAALLAARISSGRVTRRELAVLAALFGIGAGARGAQAAGRQIVLACWGGAAVRAYDQSFGKPFTKIAASASRSMAPVPAWARSGRWCAAAR